MQRTLEGTANVKSVEYISKDEALEELGRKVDDADEKIELLGTNPLPDLFRVTPDDPDELDVIEASLMSGGQPRSTPSTTCRTARATPTRSSPRPAS